MQSNSSRRWVVGDIHGCLKTFKALVQKIGLQKQDKLYLLGDYIDRGKDGAGVIDFIIELQNQGYQLFPLRGNHEDDLVQASQTYNDKDLKALVARINKSACLLDDEGKLIPKYLDFCQKLPLYFDLGGFFLVHAGLNFDLDDPLQDEKAMLVLRRWTSKADISKIGEKRIVFGHEPTPINQILEAIETNADAIPLDNGCFYTKPHKIYDVSRLGYLCCLDLDRMELILQKNIE